MRVRAGETAGRAGMLAAEEDMGPGRARWALAAAGAVGVAAFLAASTTGAHADDNLDLEVLGNEKIRSRFVTPGAEENYLCRLTRGTTFSATAKSKGKDGPVLAVALLDSGDRLVVAGSPKGRRGQRIKMPVDGTDDYRLSIGSGAENDGDYDLKVKWKPQKKWVEKNGAPVAPGAEATFAFSAPVGSTAKIDLRPSKWSELLPELLEVTGPGGFSLLVGKGPPKGPRDAAGPVPLGAAGDYEVRFRNAGATAGGFQIKVTVAAPKISKRKVDLRDVTRGEDQNVFGRAVGADGGLVQPPPSGTNLDGASVDIPPGALPSAVVITIAEEDVFFVDDDVRPGGPALAFGPAGIEFDEDVTVSIPFDRNLFTDPQNDLTVYVKREDGTVEAVPKPYDFSVPRTVRFPASRFSTFEATFVGPRPVVGTFVIAEVNPLVSADFGGGGFVAVLNAFFDGAGSVVAGGEQAAVQWTLPQGPSGPAELVAMRTTPPTPDTSAVVADDRIELSVAASPDPAHVLRRGTSNDVLVGVAPDDDRASLLMAFRLAPDEPSLVGQAGRWRVMSVGFQADFVGQDATIRVASFPGTLDLVADGTYTLSLTEQFRETTLPMGTWQTGTSPLDAQGLWEVEDCDLHVLDPGEQPGSNERISFLPVLDGDVLVGMGLEGLGVAPTAQGDRRVSLLVLVRESTDAQTADLAADAFFSEILVEAVDRPGSAQSLTAVQTEFGGAYDRLGGVTLQGDDNRVFHLGSGVPSNTRSLVGPFNGSYAIALDGVFSQDVPGGRTGAFHPGGELFVTTAPGFVFALGVPGP